MATISERFEHELEVFRREISGSIQLLYSYLTIHARASKDKEILMALNETPLFWNTAIYGLQCSFFIGLGRIFDQKSNHNIDKIIGLAQKNLNLFSKNSLAERKRKASSNADDWLDDYLKDVYVPSAEDFRRLRKHVKKYRKIYNDNYRGIRNKFFAHKELSEQSEIDKLFGKTNISEMQKLFVFTYKIHYVIWELYHNGRKPVLKSMPFSVNQIIKKEFNKWESKSLQEDMVEDSKKLMNILKLAKAQQST